MTTSLGSNIKLAMAERGVTVDALAAELGVSPRLLQKWRQDQVHPRTANMVKLARALDHDMGWFYTDHSRQKAA